MIDREEVLHVARLARLSLSEPEVEAMRKELSVVLDNVAKIGELDLRDVPPTSHAVGDGIPTQPALRQDVPQPSLPRDVALASAPAVSEDGFLVPSPGA